MSVPRSDISTFIAAWNRAVAELNRRLSDLTEPGTDSNAPDEALGRCQTMIQCHRETGHDDPRNPATTRRHEAHEETG